VPRPGAGVKAREVVYPCLLLHETASGKHISRWIMAKILQAKRVTG